MAIENKEKETEEIVQDQEVVEEEEVSSDPSETTEEEDEEETETDDEDGGLSEEELKTAKQLLRQLKNGDTAKETVLALAKTFGIELGNVTKPSDTTNTKPSEAKQRKAIADIVNAEIPDNFMPLRGMLTKILTEINAEYIESQHTVSQEEKHRERTEAAREWAVSKYEDFEELGPVMAKIAQNVAPARLNTMQDYKDYIDTIYKAAKASHGGNKDLATKLSKIVQKTKNNAKRAKPGPSDVSSTKGDVKVNTVEDAIRLAEKQLRMKK